MRAGDLYRQKASECLAAAEQNLSTRLSMLEMAQKWSRLADNVDTTEWPADHPDWQPIRTVPFDREIEISVCCWAEYDVFAYPVRRKPFGWVIDGIPGSFEIRPTHWRESTAPPA
jgi:hypothetical protein